MQWVIEWSHPTTQKQITWIQENICYPLNKVVSEFHQKLYLTKVDVPNSMSDLKKWTPILEWRMVACESKSDTQKTCVK